MKKFSLFAVILLLAGSVFAFDDTRDSSFYDDFDDFGSPRRDGRRRRDNTRADFRRRSVGRGRRMPLIKYSGGVYFVADPDRRRASDGAVFTASFSDNDRFLVTAQSGGKVRIWEIHNMKDIRLYRTMNHGGQVDRAEFSRNGDFIASVGQGRVKVWRNNGDHRRTLRGHRFESAVFSDNNEFVVTGERAGGSAKIRFWKRDNGRRTRTFSSGHPNTSLVDISRNQRYLVHTYPDDSRHVFLRSARNGRLLRILRGHTAGPYASFSLHGHYIVSIANSDRTADECYVWQVPSGRLMGRMRFHGFNIMGATMSPCEQYVFTVANRQGTTTINNRADVRVYRRTGYRFRRKSIPLRATSIAVSPHKRYVAVVGNYVVRSGVIEGRIFIYKYNKLGR